MEEISSSVVRPRWVFMWGRRRFRMLLLLCLCLPVFFTVACALSLLSENDGRVLFLASCGVLICASAAGWLLLRSWEQKMQWKVRELVQEKLQRMESHPSHELENCKVELAQARRGYEHQIDLLQSSVAKSKEQVIELNLEMDKKLEQMRQAYLEFEDLRIEYTRLEEEYERYKAETQNQVKHKDSVLADYQHTIGEQRMIIEKKQGYVSNLEGKVRDLMHEIRGLLQLEEPQQSAIPFEVPKHKPYDVSLQLNRYLEMAERFTGADHLGGRFLNSSANQYAIDLRPLFDHLREETGGILFVYSQFENRFLFVNSMVKNTLGWSGEKFMKDFSQIVVAGQNEWNKALNEISHDKEKKLRLVLRSKLNEEVSADCYMGLISKGPFANYLIGMMTL